MQALRNADVVAIAGAACTAWGQRVDAGCHRVDVGHQIQPGPVVEEAAPLWLERKQIELFMHGAAGFGEHPFQHPRQGKDGRAHVEAPAVPLQHGSLAAQPRVGLEQHDPVTATGQGHGRCQASQAAADDRNR